MFQEFLALHGSLLPASQFPQKEVCVMTGLVDVVENGCAAQFTGVVHDYVAEAHETLWNARLNSYVLNFTQGNISGRTGDQPSVNL